MKRIKSIRVLLLTLVFALLLQVACVLPVFAGSGSASISLSSKSVYVGNTVKVTVTYSSSVPMGVWDFTLSYDASVLQYVSGAQSASRGSLHFVEYPQSGGVKSTSYTVTFKAISLGDGSLSTHTNSVVCSDDYSEISISEASRTVSVVERPAASSENRLNSLGADGVTLSPEFDAGTDAYTATVPYSVTSLAFAASPKDGGASVRVNGADALAVGENTVTVVVTAENGDRRTYTVTVTREDSVFAAVTAEVDGKTLAFPRDPSEVTVVPEGFLPVEGTYQDQKVLLFSNPSGSAVVAVLLGEDEGGEGEPVKVEYLYFYDDAADAFYPYLSVQTVPQTYLLLNKPAEVPVPEGFAETMVLINQTELPAWTNAATVKEGEPPVTLVYASPFEGTAAFYTYDVLSGSFALYQTPGALLSSDGKTMEEMEAALAAANEENARLDQWLLYGAIIALAVVVILLIVIVILAVVSARRKKNAFAALPPEEGEYDGYAPQENYPDFSEPEPLPVIPEPEYAPEPEPIPEPEPEYVPEPMPAPEYTPEPMPVSPVIPVPKPVKEELPIADEFRDIAMNPEKKPAAPFFPGDEEEDEPVFGFDDE